MKKSVLLLTILMLLFPLMTNAQGYAQEYWIEGFYERLGANKYTLKDINTNGIKFDGKTGLSDTLYGKKIPLKCNGVDATMIQFSLANADLKCDNPDITFQYWNDATHSWKSDIAACKGESTSVSNKNMIMVLVLDYSNSISSKIDRMKNMACNFIRNAANYSNGNIHIGIIAFSGMDNTNRQIMKITPLKKDNTSTFERFIKYDSKPGMETALYYAFDNAINMIDEYANTKNFNEENYNGSCLITFTDGLDNASINDKISPRMQRGIKNEYLVTLTNTIQKGLLQKKVLGLPIESYAVGYTGSEYFSTEDLTLFRQVLQRLTTDENHFMLSNDFAAVEDYYNQIFEQLTSRWKTLNLYVRETEYGMVRWVFRCNQQVAQPAPKPVYTAKPETKPTTKPATKPVQKPTQKPTGNRTPWFGISAEIGVYGKTFGGLNFDMAFSINNTFAIGGRLGVIWGSYDEYYYNSYYDWYWDEYYYNSYTKSRSTTGIIIGPEVKITFQNNAGIIAGLGYGSVNDIGSLYLRAGWKTRKSFFVTTETLIGDGLGIGVGLGFSFGGKPRR